MTKERLHGLQRLASRKQAGCECAAPAVAGCEVQSRGTVEPLDVRLEAVGCTVFDDLALGIDGSLGVQLIGSALPRENQPGGRAQPSILPVVEGAAAPWPYATRCSVPAPR